jgi:anti-anti-sigma regulatory factor
MVVRMAMITVWPKIDEQCVVQALRDAGEKLDGAEGEVVLDFSSVRRIDSNVLTGLKEFASLADDKRVKVALRGVSIDVYKVLKLVKLASRFSFVN